MKKKENIKKKSSFSLPVIKIFQDSEKPEYILSTYFIYLRKFKFIQQNLFSKFPHKGKFVKKYLWTFLQKKRSR